MKIGICGLPFSGKTTLFNALTGSMVDTSFASGKKEAHYAIIKVPDERLDRLAEILQPPKKIPATVEYIDLTGLSGDEQKKGGFSDYFLGQIRTVDAVLVIVRNFHNDNVPHPLNTVDPERDLKLVESEFILGDLSIIENRISRLERQMRANKTDQDVREREILLKLKKSLEDENPLRNIAVSTDDEHLIRGYQFLTCKPYILVINIDENDMSQADEIAEKYGHWTSEQNVVVLPISARIEMEIRQLPEDEAVLFRDDLGLTALAMERLIKTSYDLLGLLSFFTFNEEELRAWTIRQNTHAPQAAGAVHTDMEKGFIRAEVVHFDDFFVRKSMAKCRDDGVLHVEGKDYIVQDGDIIHFRFAV